MARLLRQSTAFTFRIGPFVDSTDGVTAETALTIAQADIQISKNGGAFAQTSASPTTTHDTDGWYQCPLTTTDTNTLGSLTVQIVVAGALPVWEHFTVVPANVYDSLVSGTDNLQVDAVQWAGSATATDDVALSAATAVASQTDVTTLLSRLSATRAANLDNLDVSVNSRLASASYTAPDNATITAIEADTTDIQSRLPAALIGGRMSSQVGAMGADVWDSGAVATSGATEIRDAIGNASDASYTTADTLGNTLRLLKSGATGLVPFTVGTSSTTTSVTTNLTEATNDHYNGRTVVFLSGALAGQAATITDYVGATKVLTVSALTEAPANADLAVIV